MEEPTILDFVKALLTPWRGKIPQITPEEKGEDREVHREGLKHSDFDAPLPIDQLTIEPSERTHKTSPQPYTWPWRALIALGLALVAQRSLEPAIDRMWFPGAVFYLIAILMILWAIWAGELTLPKNPKEKSRQEVLTFRHILLLIYAPLLLVAFVMFGGNRFTGLNLLVWLGAIVALVSTFWLSDSERISWFRHLWQKFRDINWKITLTPWTVLFISAVILSFFFRTYQLDEVPPEMTSDHAEKLLDVGDILRGETSIFFVRNTGREPLQMYLTAAVARLFGTGLSFTSLKIGTILAGLLTLPFIYLLGVELANRRAGLLAMTFAGIAYWPNVISRASLRFALYPLFVAATLYFLIRGIRRSSMNDFILAGIMLGIGLHGYTPIRILPIVLLVAIGLYLIHQQSIGQRQATLWRLFILSVVGFTIFLPLFRYWLSEPDMFIFRTLTRVTSLERPLPGTPVEIFLQNLWNALTMYSWDNGRVWLVSVTNRPALDVVSGALFHLGIVLVFVRYIRRRHWLDLFLLLAVPLLMMPSILSLAFPEENPVLNRTGGALVVVFLIIGIALDSLLSVTKTGFKSPFGTKIMVGITLLLLTWSASQNYDLVFKQYQRNYAASAWNTSELGNVIRNFADSIGSADTAYVVPYPHWVDTRLVAIYAGYPSKDYALWPEEFPQTIRESRVKLFMINLNDHESVEVLQQLYPHGWLNRYISKYPNKSFYIFIVPPQETRNENHILNEVIID
jgi:hypothetical protein